MTTTYPLIELAARLYPRYDLLYVTSTDGGTHASGSYHYRHQAADFGSGIQNAAELKANHATRYGQMNAFAAYFYVDYKWITELEHTRPYNPLSGWYVKNGRKVSGLGTYGRADVLAHRDHVHVAEATLGEANGLLTIKIQRTLGLHADGVRGPATVAAIKAIQKSYGLTVDGIPGVHTIDAIRAKVGYPKV